MQKHEVVAPRDELTGLWRLAVPVGDGRAVRVVATLVAPWLADLPADTVLLGFDVDDFHGFNRAFGHPAGDALLAELGARLRAAADPWPAFRWGPALFVVAVRLPDEDAIRAQLVAIRSELERPMADGRCVTVSVGAARAWANADIDHLLVALDEALYPAKCFRNGWMLVTDGPTGMRHTHRLPG